MRRVVFLVLAVAAIGVAVVVFAVGHSDTGSQPLVSAARIAPAPPKPEHCTTDIELVFDPQLDHAALIRAVASVVRSPDSNAAIIRSPIKAFHTDVENNVACLTLEDGVDPATVASFIAEIGTGTAVTQVRIR